MIKKALILCLFVFFLLQSFGVSGFAAEGTEPVAVIEQTVNSILSLLNDKSLSKAERRPRIRAIIFKQFDFEEMSRRILGTNWRKLTSEQRKEFVDLFSRLLEASYSCKLDTYSSETVTFERQIIRGRYAMVYTLVHTSTADIPLDYKLINKRNNWYVYDVKIEGVSLVSNYRTSYNEIIRKEGFAKLVEGIKKKLMELQCNPAETDSSTKNA